MSWKYLVILEYIYIRFLFFIINLTSYCDPVVHYVYCLKQIWIMIKSAHCSAMNLFSDTLILYWGNTVHTSFFLLWVLAVISLAIFSQCKAPGVPKSTRLNSLVIIRLISVMEKLIKCDTQVQVQAMTLLIDVKQSSSVFLQLLHCYPTVTLLVHKTLYANNVTYISRDGIQKLPDITY